MIKRNERAIIVLLLTLTFIVFYFADRGTGSPEFVHLYKKETSGARHET